MSALRTIRQTLGVTQSELAAGIGVTQGSVSFYEQGVTVMPPPVAAKLIEFAQGKGHTVRYDDIYGAPAPVAEPTTSAQA